MRILHPTDFSRTAEKALVLARDLSVRTEGSLHIAHVQQRYRDGLNHPYLQPQLDSVNPTLSQRQDEDRQMEAERLRSMLQHLAASEATTELRWGETLRELLDMAPAYELLVMGAHGSNRLDQVFLGGIANRVVRRSPTPVITVRQEASATRVQRIMVATDMSDASRNALAFSLKLRRHGVKILLAHVLDNPRLQDDSTYTREVTSELAAMAGDRVERHMLLHGNPVTALPAAAAEAGADLIAIGVRRHDSALGFLLGSRADGLVRSSHVPILSVPYQS